MTKDVQPKEKPPKREKTPKTPREPKVKINRSWNAWCERNGFNEDLVPGARIENTPKYWTRTQFKTALNVLPANHPDRWKFETGARFSMSPSHSGFMTAVYTSMIIMNVAVLMLVVPSILHNFIPGIVLGGLFVLYWIVYILRWRKAMAR